MHSFFKRPATSMAAVAVALCMPIVAHAQTRSFNIREQPASSGIHEFARQSGIQITVAGRDGEGRITNKVRGKLDVRAALEQLVSGTGLTIRSFDGKDAVLAAEGERKNEERGDIVVTGTRAALRQAIDEKRTSENIVEALHANDVGKLPDQNVAEAVKRLPGLSVANDQGEGRYVIIRGIDPNLVNVTLNGQTLPAPEPDGRQVKLDDLPSAMIQSITVEAEAARELEQPVAQIARRPADAQLGQSLAHVLGFRSMNPGPKLRPALAPCAFVVRCLADKHMRSPEVIPKRRHAETGILAEDFCCTLMTIPETRRQMASD